MGKLTLAEMCKTARAHAGLSQKKFAEIIGTNQTEISFIERGFVPTDENKCKAINSLYWKAGMQNERTM